MSLARVERSSFRRFLSRSGNFVLPLPAKKGSRANARWYLARNATRCFSSIDVAIPFPSSHPHPLSLSFFFSLSTPLSIFPSFYDSNSLDRIFAMFHPSNFDHHPPALFPPIISLPFSSHFRRNTRSLSARSGCGLSPLVPLQPRKSKLDAKTRPNVHSARYPTYRVSGTIADGHRFPPPGRDKCEDGEYRRFVRWLP